MTAMERICRVLVVEDNGDVRDLLREVFAQEGYRFAVVENGRDMRRALVQGDVDVVIIDVHLRGESGFDLAREAAGQGHAVVLTTGDHTFRQRLEATGYKHILKPYRLEALLAVVEAALDETRVRCETRRRRFGQSRAPL
jgi:two-component system, NtrC family, nitrogen regulation response regulator NtrX